MKKLLALFICSTTLVYSAPFTLKDTATGTTYQCGPGSAGPVDPNCVSQTAEYCNHNTGFDRDTCFNIAKAACAHGMAADCVSQTADYCNHNTGFDRDTCFNKGIESCSGNPQAIQGLAEAARLKFITEFNRRALEEKSE